LARYPLGSGLGTGGPAAGQSGAPAATTDVNTETEFSFATLESGIPGMVALVGFTTIVIFLALRRCRYEPDLETRLLLAAIIAPIAGMLVLYWVSPITPTTPSGPYLWAAGGIASYWLIERQRSATKIAGVDRLQPPYET
jgi:O-antigen ligase